MSRGYIHPGATLPFLPIAKSGQDPFIKRLAEYLQLKVVAGMPSGMRETPPPRDHFSLKTLRWCRMSLWSSSTG